MPVSVQDLQDELVQDMLVAASALRDLCGERRERQSEPSTQHSSPDQTRPVLMIHFPLEGKDITQTLGAAAYSCAGYNIARGLLIRGKGGNEIQSTCVSG